MKHGKVLGKLSPARFLREYWQKKPLLIRNAFPDFSGLLSKNELMSLSGNADAESRLVCSYRNKWTLVNGPFKKRDFTKQTGNWTLLVQNVNHFLPKAEALLKNFNFIPHARLDDLMISYAPDGGGVGPHFDSYDVFLLQGSGKRLWQISKQEDLRILPNTPLRILADFKPTQEWLLEPGDMLYLPPNYAHNGIAMGDCMTYSIGFRAPGYQELAHEFLFYLQDQLDMKGIYADPNLKIAKHPAQISAEMINGVAKELKKIRFEKKIVGNFLGKYLSEPKANVFFNPPVAPLSKNKFFKLAIEKGIRLDLKSQMLFTDERFFINGEEHSFSAKMKPYLQKLANERELKVSAETIKQIGDLFYEWYLDGFLGIYF